MAKPLEVTLVLIMMFCCGLALGFTVGGYEARKDAYIDTSTCKHFIENSKSPAVKKDKYKYYLQCIEIQQGE